ncbi:DUF305 domain-containing protein [Streptomyces sp. CMB-StM0423]|uniref:DUF305 domain-containing protein n=1 Tax=Streptomyces sp. CMB-StM0423 TaxID=2059884 RepID=UPI000C6FE1CA|nr:DUF305 domain-containing protein [Streptomyces sp. CMB-StM0423]AUH42075.1 DUF305 domain-containing protein [Streptomyces sp. CMB-StM0423]
MIRTRSLFRRGAAVATAGAVALLLAACGGNDDESGDDGKSGASASGPAASQEEHNDADVTFAKGMIPHHRQAVEMADLAPDRAASDEVKKLAADIKKAQDPEIETLSGWLTSWGEEVPAEGGMDHSMHGSAGGMMSAEDMETLEKAKGAAFDTAFTEMMIEHHEGAVAMAETEQADGSYAPAKEMAGQIISSQEAEIDAMTSMLDKV